VKMVQIDASLLLRVPLLERAATEQQRREIGGVQPHVG